MRYIHREGTVGDFGRAGLLFLMDVAMAPADIASQLHAKEDDPVTDAALALADYILDGDFTDVLAAGLGAVYSLLPYKLVVKRRIEEESDGISNNGAGMILGMAPVGTVDEERRKRDDEEQRIMTLGVEVSSNPDFKARLDHFLNLIEFAEDVLRRTVFDGVDNVGEGVAASTVTTINLGRAIAQAVVDKIRSIFLQNVLYPSILECSEADGSAVAVFSYIDSLLRTMVNGGKLSEAFIDFLIADDDGLGLRSSVGVGRRPQRSSHADRDTKRNRRRSSAMVLLELEAPQSMGHSDYFSSLGRFTLKDLLLTNLKGQSKQAKSVIPGPDAAGVAALRLLYLLLSDHCSKTVDGLLSVVRDPTATNFPRPPKISAPQWSTSGTILEEDDDEFIYPGASPPRLRRADPLFLQPSTTAATREEELLLYKDLIARIDPKRHDDVLGPGYDHYLKDAVEIIQGQSCYHEGLQEWVSGGLETITSPPMTKQHRLLPTDPLLNSLLSALRNYFSYSPEYNVALTGVIASICACPHRSMAGWLTLASANDSSHEGDAWIKSKAVDGASPTPYNHASDSDGDDASIDAPENNPQPPDSRLRDPKFQPVLYTILSGLVAQLDRYRMIVDDFDTLLDDRRHGLMFVENLNDALTLTIQANEFIQTGNSTSLSVPKPSGSTTPNPSPKPKAKSNLSFVPSFLAPKKSKSGTSDGASVSQGGNKGGLLASPFTSHYQRTTLVEVEPFVAPAPSVGAWSESSKRGIRGTESLGLGGVSMGMSGLGGFDSDDVFASSTGQHRQQEEEEEEATVTISLSRLLDNVVILEESIKELVAIAQVRCSLGIDSVRYV
ncbi:hypothetical protein FRC02_002475 [Tulasnella sp. 418]|nr:hypothetical protein FRC02_002475 [Tulasnella sp. 418]